MNRQDPGRARRVTGTVLTWLGSFLLLASATAKFAHVPKLVAELGANGITRSNVDLVAVLEATGAILFALPHTRRLGLLVVSAFMGGAIATHLEHNQSVVAPALVLGLFWAAAWLHGSIALVRERHTRTVAAVTSAPAKILSWVPRLVLLPPATIFTMIAVRNLAHPVHEAALAGIALTTPLAVTIARIGFGAFPLAFAIITIGCLVSERRVLTGLGFVLVVVGAVLGVRLLGMQLDGTARESMHLVIPELVLLGLTTFGTILEIARRRSGHLPAQAQVAQE